MNVNLDTQYLNNFRHGKLVTKLYNFTIRWVSPDSINIPYDLDSGEIKRAKQAIKDNRRQSPVVVLHDIGIVAGLHNLQAYSELKYDQIPIIYGKLK
jgi:glutaredoxin